MTTERLIEHLRRIEYSPKQRMNLEKDRQLHEQERDILEDLYYRGLTLKEIQRRRNGT